ncbi:MAG: hypothetical protein HON04_03340 [Planctomicrobium sp.]|jgi:hypothetical protein|nr:hypothetical protein [Planctomicrobium sp.]
MSGHGFKGLDFNKLHKSLQHHSLRENAPLWKAVRIISVGATGFEPATS